MTRPEGNDGTKGITGLDFVFAHLPEGGAESGRERTAGARLNLDLCHLKRTKGDIGKDLCGCRASQPDSGLVLGGNLLASQVHVCILEHFIETILEEALQGVTDKGRTEALPDTGLALLPNKGGETRAEALVFSWVYLQKVKKWNSEIERATDLHVAFGNIQWCNTGMCKTTGKNTTKHALGIVGRIMGNGAEVSGKAT